MRPGAVQLAIAAAMLVSPPALLRFFRSEPEDENRQEAFSTIFEITSIALQTAAELKPEWTQQWHERTERDLPPKYQPDQFIHPDAVDAAYDTRYGYALLQRNRWRSKIEPLFATVDHDSWSRVRATVERLSPALINARERYWDSLRIDERSWIDRAVEGLDDARYMLRQADRREIPQSELVSETTFRLIYVTVQLSETMLDRLREDAAEER